MKRIRPVTAIWFISASALYADPAFDEAVRDSLLRNPEVILEVLQVLEERDAETARQSDVALIDRFATELFPEGQGAGPVLVEFIDYQCSYCKRAGLEVVALEAAHPSVTRRVLQFPILGEDSVSAALVMEALRQIEGDATFLAAHDALLQGDGRAIHDLRGFLVGQGIDADPILAFAETDEVRAAIAATHGLARNLGIDGTPGFVTSDTIIRGFADADRLAQALGLNMDTASDQVTRDE